MLSGAFNFYCFERIVSTVNVAINAASSFNYYDVMFSTMGLVSGFRG